MKPTVFDSNEPLELYSDYKTKQFNSIEDILSSLLDKVAGSSLTTQDKKVILVKMENTIRFETLTKF